MTLPGSCRRPRQRSRVVGGAPWAGVTSQGFSELLTALPMAIDSRDRLLNPLDSEVSIGSQTAPQPDHEEPAKPPTPFTEPVGGKR